MSESLECIGSESNMQIPSETRSKPHTLRTQTQLREWRVGELAMIVPVEMPVMLPMPEPVGT